MGEAAALAVSLDLHQEAAGGCLFVFFFYMQRKLYKSSGLCSMVPKVDQCLWKVMLKLSCFGVTSLCGQELLPKGKIWIWFSPFPKQTLKSGTLIS